MPPDMMNKTLKGSTPKTYPGPDGFYMAGQWVQAGGGLPSGLSTGGEVVMQMCKQDGRCGCIPHPGLGLNQQPVQYLPGLLTHRGMQAVAMGIHGDHGWEVSNIDHPDGFWNAEVQFINPQHFFNRLGNQ